MVRNTILLFLLALLLFSCESYTSSPRFEGDVFTIAALLKTGKTISVEDPLYITKSALIEDFNPFDIFVMDATATVTNLDTGHSWMLEPFVDLSQMKLKWIDPAENIILSETRYRVQIQIPGYDKDISAETLTPPTVELVPDYYGHNLPTEGYSFSPEEPAATPYAQLDIRYPLALNTFDNGGTQNFMAELFCLEPFSTSLEYTTPIMGMTHATEDMESAYYSSGEGLRRIRFLGRFFSTVPPQYEDNFILLKDYRIGFIFYGKYRVSVYITDDNFYKYQYMPDGYLHGGVQNALGYFGSASGGVMYIDVTK